MTYIQFCGVAMLAMWKIFWPVVLVLVLFALHMLYSRYTAKQIQSEKARRLRKRIILEIESLERG